MDVNGKLTNVTNGRADCKTTSAQTCRRAKLAVNEDD